MRRLKPARPLQRPNNMVSTSIDTSELDRMIGAINNALIGTGGDASEITKDESRLLATQLMKLAQPKDRKALGNKIEANVRSRFAALNEDNATSDSGLGVSADGTNWYAADSNFLYGSRDAVNMRKASGDEIASVFYTSVFKGGKARLIYDFTKSKKKHQKIAITQRIITSKASLARGVRKVKESIGKLAASWFATAKTIDPSASAPNWIADHLHGNKTSKSITDLTGAKDLANPSVTFGSKAHAVSSKKGVQQVQFAMNIRTKKLKHRLELILSGYAEDVRHGIKVARKAHKVKGSP